MFRPHLICSDLIYRSWLALAKDIYSGPLPSQQLTVRMLEILRVPPSIIVLFLVAFVVFFFVFNELTELKKPAEYQKVLKCCS